MTKRSHFRRLIGWAAPVLSLAALVAGAGLPVQFVDVAHQAGLRFKTIFGGVDKNLYLLETNGCGIAFFDYDNDGWPDIFQVNGTRFGETFPKGSEPTNRLYRNNHDGTFADVTVKAGLVRTGWGQGVCIGDYDNDGHDDLYVAYWGPSSLYRNNGNGTFTDVSAKAGVSTAGGRSKRWNTGCAFVDYDRDGLLDLFVANYLDWDPALGPTPEGCLYRGMSVACGPPGLKGGKNILYHNNGNGTFTDVSRKMGIEDIDTTYGLGVLVSDFDDDGWPDIYVANDSQASALYHNRGGKSFTEIGVESGVAFSADGKNQGSMGVDAGDFDGDGRLDIVKTNFANDLTSLYRNLGDNVFEDVAVQTGVGRVARFLSWGVGFFDFDNDTWPDLLITNGHVYPEMAESASESGYLQPKELYHNRGDGTFADVSAQGGPGITRKVAGRGTAFADYDNDGDLDVVVNVTNDLPQLLRCESRSSNNWLKVKAVGVKSNRSGIGARVYCTPKGGRRLIGEVRSGGSYISQNDLRLHFGLGPAKTADIEIRWPSGIVDVVAGVAANQVIRVQEGSTEISPSNRP